MCGLSGAGGVRIADLRFPIEELIGHSIGGWETKVSCFARDDNVES